MYQEKDYVRQIREVNARANKAAQRLYWDPEQKRIRPMSDCDPDRSALEVTKPDLGHSATDGEDSTVITIFADTLKECCTEGSLDLQFHRWDNGDAYTQVIAEENARYTVPGILLIDRDNGPVDVSEVCTDEVQVCVVARWRQNSSDQDANCSRTKGEWKTTGFVREEGRWQEASVEVIPLREDLFNRTKGLYESKVLSDAWVLTAGLGSVGSFVTELLAMSGIMNQITIDYERVELANVIRQNASICDCGRYKTKVAAQKIYNKNIYANTESYELRITWQNQEFVRGLVRRSDIVIGPVDKREPRIILNRLCVEEGKPLILMGAFHRAFGVQILFMRRPRIDPCYMCYLMSLPPEEKNRWSSNLDRGWLKDDLIQVVEAPAPPKEFLALIKPVYWPAAGVWAWPGREGLIVFYNQRSNEVNCVWSGTGEVYAMVICNEQLLTIGTDGRARHWRLGASEPANTFETPHRIVSATSWQQDNSVMLLLINDKGKAGVYLLTDMSLELIKPLPGRDYRTAVGPDAEKLRLAVQQQKMIRVKELTAQINEKIVRQQYSELEDYYNNLDELGYRQVALSLRGQEARSKNDFVAELKTSSELVDIIPHDHPGSKNSLVRHAELLESAWQLPEARGLYRELADRYLDNKDYPEAVQRLSEYINEIKTGRCVIDPDIAVLSLIESAIVLDGRFRGRYLLEARQPVSCRVVLGAGEFVKKYEQLCDGKPQMPTAQEMELRWLSGHKVEQIPTVVFRNEALDRFSHIELGMKFFSSRLQTVLVPVIMLNTGEKTDGISVEKYNGNLIKELRHNEDDHFKGWLEMVEDTINHTVCRLITPKKAERIRQSGGIRC